MRRLAFVLGVWLAAFPVAAQEAGWRPYLFLNNVGGLNDGADPTAIQDNEASDIQNMVFTIGGQLAQRQGFSPIAAGNLPPTAQFTGVAFYRLASGTRELVATTLTGTTSQIRKMDYLSGTQGPNGSWTDISGSLTLAFAVDNHSVFCPAQDQLVIEDGVTTTAPMVWTGTGNATLLGGSPPNSSMCSYHKNILFLAGDSANPSRVSFSNIGDIATWTSTDTINVSTNDGQILTGLRSALDCEYEFKTFSIFRTCGTDRDSFVTELMVRGVGAASNNVIQLINNQFVFLTSEGLIAVYDGGVNIQYISPKIQGTLNGLNRNRLAQAESAAIQDQTGNISYYLAVSTGSSTTNNLLLVYDTYHKAWTKFTNMNANAMTAYETGTPQRDLLFGTYTGEAEHYPTNNSDFGAAISSFYQTKQYSFPDIPQDKDWKLLEVFVSQQGNYNLTVQTRADFESPGTSSSISLAGTGSLWDSALWDSDSWADLTTTIGRIEVNKSRRFFQAYFSHTGATQPVVIKGFTFWMAPQGRV